MIFFWGGRGGISYNSHKLRSSASKTLIKEFSPYENSLQVCSKQYNIYSSSISLHIFFQCHSSYK